MKRTSGIASTITILIVLTAVLVNSPLTAHARALSPVKDASFSVSASMGENLKNYLGKDVVIYLSSGKNFQSYVKNIGDQLIHLEKIAGKDFYDALIRIDDIIAIEAKFREMK
jgi:hypothetical protein